jgi:hypothetical protein
MRLAMTAKNEHTGALIQSIPTKKYQDNFGGIDWSIKLNTDEPLCSECGEIECKCSNK